MLWPMHALLYVLPSHPQTGANSFVQPSGRGLQTPMKSPAPHGALSGKSHHSVGAQTRPAIPPHPFEAPSGATSVLESPPESAGASVAVSGVASTPVSGFAST